MRKLSVSRYTQGLCHSATRMNFVGQPFDKLRDCVYQQKINPPHSFFSK